MKRNDRIKLQFSRNWKFPGRERLSHWLKPSAQLKSSLNNGIVWLTDEPIAIHTSADNYIEWNIISSGTYEDEIGKLINISLRPGFVALDIGANIGLQSLRMSNRVAETGSVYAFEPLIHLQEKFRKNIALNRAENVTLFPFALSDREAEETFTFNKNDWNQGTFSIGKTAAGSENQKVTIRIADQIDEIKNLTRLDLVKIDVEGFEFDVIKGLYQTISKYRPRVIFEYDKNYWTNSGKSIADCCKLMTAINYEFYQITQVGCQLVTVNEIESGNILCLPLINE